jgi:hypothetical protein
VGNESPIIMFPHAAEGRFWLSGQATFVYQTNRSFMRRTRESIVLGQTTTRLLGGS